MPTTLAGHVGEQLGGNNSWRWSARKAYTDP
jgi:hypothetical protein